MENDEKIIDVSGNDLYSDAQLQELQVWLNVNLQKLASQASDNGYDILTAFNFIHGISEVYIDQIKSEWKKFSENREEYVKSTLDIVEKLEQE